MSEEDLRIEIAALRETLAEMRMEVLQLRQKAASEQERAEKAERGYDELLHRYEVAQSEFEGHRLWFEHTVASWRAEEEEWVEERARLTEQIKDLTGRDEASS